MSITTHVLDTARGRPAAGIPVTLSARGEDGGWREIGRGTTDADGRLRTLVPAGAPLSAGTYEIAFDVRDYHRAQGADGFYEVIAVRFRVHDPAQHYHVPLLLSPFGYSTYRGS